MFVVGAVAFSGDDFLCTFLRWGRGKCNLQYLFFYYSVEKSTVNTIFISSWKQLIIIRKIRLIKFVIVPHKPNTYTAASKSWLRLRRR